MSKIVDGMSECDFCATKLDQVGSIVFDAKTPQGPWGTACPKCFRTETLGRLGTGFGQKFQRDENLRLVKLEG